MTRERPMIRVFLDPDGTQAPGWIAVIVGAPTGVVYIQQCAGTATDERALEGFLIPLGGASMTPESGPIDPAAFTAIFHRGRACAFGGGEGGLPADRLARLRALVEALPCWSRIGDEDRRDPLRLDDARLDALVEAWVPVLTPHGPGVLVWANCD